MLIKNNGFRSYINKKIFSDQIKANREEFSTKGDLNDKILSKIFNFLRYSNE